MIAKLFIKLMLKMDDEYDSNRCLRSVFCSFVCVALSLLLGLQVYTNFWGPRQEAFDSDFSGLKYVVMQLTRSLSEVNNKHQHLQKEMERISSALPALSAATGRAKDAIEPSLRRNTRHLGDVYDYDRQMADYALESAGGRVIDTGDSIEHMLHESPVGRALYLFTAWMCPECLGARAIIQPGTLPGECWAFKGSKGEAVIRLLGTVRITGISLEHIPALISPTREISSAPRLFQVEGLETRHDSYPHEFGSYEYDHEGRPIQYFEVLYPSPRGYNMVRIRIVTNWGHPVYTCVYRFRVHGELMPGQSPRSVPEDGDMVIENE